MLFLIRRHVTLNDAENIGAYLKCRATTRFPGSPSMRQDGIAARGKIGYSLEELSFSCFNAVATARLRGREDEG